jgi:hypothetical protein
LGDRYDAINAKYFDGVLNRMPVIWEPRFRQLGSIVGAAFTLEGSTDGHIILLNPDLMADESELQRALCHEMVHTYLRATGDATTVHGPAFQTVLRRLSEQGAFEGIFATPEEKARLRAELDAEFARLDAEERDLDRISAELEAMRSSVTAQVSRASADAIDPADIDYVSAKRRLDLFNQRVSDFNSRSARLKGDAAAFNRRTEYFKLVISYPDGLDEPAEIVIPLRP